MITGCLTHMRAEHLFGEQQRVRKFSIPLEYKCVRLTLESNNSTAYAANGNSADTFPVCWNGTSEVVTTGRQLPITTQCANLKPVATPVHLVPALAVMPNPGERVVHQEPADTP